MDLFEIVGRFTIEGTDEARNRINDVTGTAQESSGIFSTVGGKIAGAVATAFATQKIVAFGKDVIGTTQSFSDAMLKVQSLSGASKEELQKLNDTALKYGSTTAWTSSQVADAMGYMALAGFNTDEIMASLGGTLGLASASGTDLAVASDILTDALTAFGYSAKDANLFADVLATTQAKSNTTVEMLGEAFKYVAPLAGTYSYSVESVSTALGMMANAGIKGSMAGTSMASIITRLATNTNGARDKIESLGISFYNADGSARDLSLVLTELSDATANMTAEEKASIAQKVAGQEAQKGLLAILNQGSGAYKELENTLRSCDGTASDMSSNMESGMGGAIRTMDSALEGFKIKLGQKFEPYVTTALQTLAKFVTEQLIPDIDTGVEKLSELKKWFEEHKTTVEAVISVMEVLTASFIAFKAGAMIQGVVQGFQEAQLALALFKLETQGASIAQGLLNGQLTIGQTVVGLLTGQVTLAEVATALWSKAQMVLNAVMSANPIALIVMAIGALIAIFVVAYKKSDTFRNAVDALWGKIKEFGSKLLEWAKGIPDAIVSAFNFVIDFVKNNWQGLLLLLVNPFAGAFKLLYDNCDGFKNFIDNFIKNVKTSIKNGIDKIISFFNSAIDFVKNNWQAILLFLINPFAGAFKLLYDNCNGFRNFINNFVQNVKTSIKNGIDATINFFAELPAKLGYILGYAIGTVIQWTIDMHNKAIELGTNFINTIVEFFITLPDRLIEFFTNAYNATVEWTVNMYNSAVELATNFINTIVEFFTTLPEKLLNIFTTILTNVTNWVTDMVTKATEVGTTFVNNVVNVIQSLPQKLLDIFTSVLTNVANWLASLSTKCANGAIKVYNAIVNGVKNLPSKMKSIGSDLVKGIWDGIKNSEKWLKGKVSDFSDGIVKGFKKALKINSPSRVMMDVGNFLTQGLGVGIEEDDSAEKSISEKVDDILDIANGSVANIKVGTSIGGLNAENPINKYQLDFNAQFSALNDGFENLVNLVGEYLPNIAGGMDRQLVLDGSSLVVGVSRKMDNQLGRMAIAKGRGNV